MAKLNLFAIILATTCFMALGTVWAEPIDDLLAEIRKVQAELQMIETALTGGAKTNQHPRDVTTQFPMHAAAAAGYHCLPLHGKRFEPRQEELLPYDRKWVPLLALAIIWFFIIAFAAYIMFLWCVSLPRRGPMARQWERWQAAQKEHIRLAQEMYREMHRQEQLREQ